MRPFAVAAAFFLAGCVVPAATETEIAPSEPPVLLAAVEEAKGDAFEPSAAADLAALACYGLCPLPDAVRRGDPAPYFDVVSAAITDGGDFLALSVEIAGLAEGFPELDRGEGPHRRVAFYQFCLVDDEDAWGCATLMLARAAGELSASASYGLYDEKCAAFATGCLWEVPVTLTAGIPATVTFEVPKAYVAWNQASRTITWVEGWAWWVAVLTETPQWHVAYSVHTPAMNAHDHPGGFGNYGYDMEQFGGESNFVVASVRPAPSLRAGGPEIVAPPGNVWADGGMADRPELDLLAIDMDEDEGDLVATFTVASYHAPTFDHIMILWFAKPGSAVWELGYIHETPHGGYGFAGVCVTLVCDGEDGSHDMSQASAAVVEAEVVPGTPGVLRVRAPMTEFASIAPGDAAYVMGISAVIDGGVWFGRFGEPVYGDAHKMSTADFRDGGTPYVFEGGAGSAAHHP